MKKFLGILIMTLIIVEAFVFHGGHVIFDFNKNLYGAGDKGT